MGDQPPPLPSLPIRDVANPYLDLHRERMGELLELGFREGGESAANPLAAMYMSLMVAPVRRLYAWAVPERDTIHEIAEAAPRGVVEVGAGTGYWAHLLHASGVSVAAYDVAPVTSAQRNGHHAVSSGVGGGGEAGAAQPGGRGGMLNAPPFFGVAAADAAAAAAAHPDRALLLCWPPPEGDAGGPSQTPEEVRSMGYSAVRAFAGDTLIYVGELPDELTGGAMEPRWALEQRSRASAGADEPGSPGATGGDDASAALAERAAAAARAGARPCSTGGPLLHEALRRDWQLERRMAVPQWPMARDMLTVWKRRGGAQPTAADAGPPPALEQSRPLTEKEQGRAVALRAQILDHHRLIWEEAAVAGLLERRRTGGSRPAPGVEQEALAAALRRAPLLRRIVTKGLLMF